MSLILQYIVIVLAVAWALWTLARKLLEIFKPTDDGCSGCSACPSAKSDGLVSVRQHSQRKAPERTET